LVFHAVGLDCSDDAVPALRPLKSRAPCFIAGNFSARDYLGLLPLRGPCQQKKDNDQKTSTASDFDQTLSFNDSGVVLSELIGFHSFHNKGLADINLVQQGAELSYLILHDPDFRRLLLEHLVETGRRIRLKHDVALFVRVLDNLGEEHKFNFNVISAAPQEIVQSALEGIVPPDHIFGTRFRYNEATGEVDSIIRATAGRGKISVLEELRANLGISHDHIIYLGDGSSDLPMMRYVNQHDGLTIA
jgi:HAD superfamily phosphoserine phosphatase-like hydrolase